jgi:antirestriction protein ArdC
VFNVEQCDGLLIPQIEQPTTAPEIDADEACEAIVTGWESRPALHLTSETEHRAYYRPSTDSVHMPPAHALWMRPTTTTPCFTS